VFKAFDEALQRVVAIKVLSPQFASNATARKRFTREAQAAAAVAHEHVVTIHAVEDSGPVPYIVMQFVAGISLQDRLDRTGALELKEILRIGLQTACGLAAAHAQGLVHRDIKPANILLENGIERVKITDFGLARAVDDAGLTQSGVVAGTPMYMAPEQAAGDPVDHRADLFSLGSVLYALCTGRPPFRASGTLAVLRRVSEEEPRPIQEINPEIPDWLGDIIAKLHAKRPEDRFQSAYEVAELLEQHLAHFQQPGQVPLPPRVSRPRAYEDRPAPRAGARPSRSQAWLVAAVLLLVLAVCLIPVLVVVGVGGALSWAFMSRSAEQPAEEEMMRKNVADEAVQRANMAREEADRAAAKAEACANAWPSARRSNPTPGRRLAPSPCSATHFLARRSMPTPSGCWSRAMRA
jgi:serine/threonine protein kinase